MAAVNNNKNYFETKQKDVKIAYYNDNNMKRYWQKSALFAIANRISVIETLLQLDGLF